MVLNYIWIAFFVIAFVVALLKTIIWGDTEVFGLVMNSTFDSAKTAFELSLGLTGVLALWLGLMKIGERAGVVAFFARLTSPFFVKLFPSLPKNHPAMGSIFMNLSANMLGLDNAATPLGLKAMREMQEVNPVKEKASDAMIMFLTLNTSGLTLIPVGVMVYRAQLGASNPSDVFLPILIATFVSTMVGILFVCYKQRISLLNGTMITWLGGLTVIIGGLVAFLLTLDKDQLTIHSSLFSNLLLLSIIMGFILGGVRKKINVYDAFIDGAKEGFQVAVTIIPYLIAILVGIGVFRASGAMDLLIDGIKWGVGLIGLSTEFVDALPTALMKPLSGSGARGMMVDAIKTHGVDSLIGYTVSVVQGATDTTFYILAVYFGSVGIKNSRYAVSAGLIADISGLIAALILAHLFFA